MSERELTTIELLNIARKETQIYYKIQEHKKFLGYFFNSMPQTRFKPLGDRPIKRTSVIPMRELLPNRNNIFGVLSCVNRGFLD